MNISAEQSDSADRRLQEVISAYRGQPQSPEDHWRTALTFAFYGGDLNGGERILAEALAEVPALIVLDHIVAPALHDIGALWERNQITIADEHVATWVAQRLLSTVAPALRLVSTLERETVLLAAPAPERHTTALMMAEAVLRGAGYQPVFLGAGIPVAALADAVARHRPAIVAFSTTMAFPLELEAALRTVLEQDPQVRLLVGGTSSALAPRSLPTAQVSGMGELIGAVEQALG